MAEFREYGPQVFGYGVDPERQARGNWGVEGHRGGMISAGFGGPINGRGANLFLIDDPIKTPEEASSQAFRDDQWEWFTQVAIRRAEPGCCFVMLYTPWHEDDIGQRILKASSRGDIKPWDVLRIPILSETQEERDEWSREFNQPEGQPDPVGREAAGEPLWAEKVSMAEIEWQRRSDPVSFASQQMGWPRPRRGVMFDRGWLASRVVNRGAVPVDAEYVRFWDLASSEGRGDWTRGCLMARSKDGRYFVCDMKGCRHSPGQRDRYIRRTCEMDRDQLHRYRVGVQRDPGAAGITASEEFVRLMEGFTVKVVSITGDKETNFGPFASHAENGNVFVVGGDWNEEFFRELERFPNGKHDDQVDVVACGFNELAKSVSRPGVVVSGGARRPFSGAMAGRIR